MSAKVHDELGSSRAEFRKYFRRQQGGSASELEMRVLEGQCQDLEKVRGALRGYLSAPNSDVEWTWRYWVGRELAEMRGTGCIDIMPGVRSSLGRGKFAPRADLSAQDRERVNLLLDEYRAISEQLREDAAPIGLEVAVRGKRERRPLAAGGRLLRDLYMAEQQLQPQNDRQ